MTTNDLDNADANWVQFAPDGSVNMWSGPLARTLMDSQDFTPTPFSFAVWEVTNDVHPLYRNPEAASHACILRANQSSLAGALRYMQGTNRVLVHNQAFPEAV